MRKRYWIIIVIALIVVGCLAAAYRFHPPTHRWITSNVIERYRVTEEPERTFDDVKAEIDREKAARIARFKKDEEAKQQEIERLKAEKAKLEKQLQDLRK
ncbi:MAG TPA: hypothetical protein PKH07_11930 [bacterium]|nr:hypothetical protein [bacterium]